MTAIKENKLLSLMIILILSVIISLYCYNDHVKSKLAEDTCSTLGEIINQQAYNFTSTLHGEMQMLKTLSEVIAHTDMIQTPQMSTLMLKDIVDKTEYEYILLSDTQGNAITSFGTKLNIAEQRFFQDALAGKEIINEPIYSKLLNKEMVFLAVPVVKDKKIIGVLMSAYNTEKLSKLLLSSFSSNGYAYVVNREGKIIANTTNTYTIANTDNVFDVLSQADFYEKDNYQTILNNFKRDEHGHSKYIYNNQKRIMHYGPIGINNWQIISIVPDEVIAKNANDITFSVFLLTGIFVLIFSILLFYLQRMHTAHIQQLGNIAFVDSLTGGSNFSKFKIDAQALLISNKHTEYTLVKMDVDKFKLINEIYGFTEGDKLLKNIYTALKSTLDPNLDLFARIIADEFVILVSGNEQVYMDKYHNFLATFDKLNQNNFNYKVVFPHGCCLVTHEDKDINSIFEKANFAHRLSKLRDEKICIYNNNIHTMAIREKELENIMEEALSNEEFQLYLQPKYYLSTEQLAGAEALVRWLRPDGKMIYPNEFISLFEKNGFISKLDLFIFDKACKFLKSLMDKNAPLLKISVNFSRININNPNFVASLAAIADKHGVAHEWLEIEITESYVLDNEDSLSNVLDQLHQENFTLSMDDFGTGYSSLGMLKNMSIDVIKIDKSFFGNAKDTFRTKTVIGSIMEMSKKLNIATVAEGIETTEHIELLREVGCDIVQGFYYARPMPTSDFNKLIQ